MKTLAISLTLLCFLGAIIAFLAGIYAISPFFFYAIMLVVAASAFSHFIE